MCSALHFTAAVALRCEGGGAQLEVTSSDAAAAAVGLGFRVKKSRVKGVKGKGLEAQYLGSMVDG